MASPLPGLPDLRRLAAHPQFDAAAGAPGESAAVAVILRPGKDGPELLLIRRAEREGDPWSGHMALPGGRRDPEDPAHRDTAARETREEVGIALAEVGEFVAALEPVTPLGGGAGLTIHPFVWTVPVETGTRINAEVAAAYWVPLAEMRDPAAIAEYLHEPSGVRFPALRCQGQIVWGLTHRILLQLFRMPGSEPAPMHPTVDYAPMPHEAFTLKLTARQADALRALAALEDLPPETYAAEVLAKHLYHAYTPEIAQRARSADPGTETP